MQKTGTPLAYVDPSMRIVGFSIVSASVADAIEANEATANTLITSTTDCAVVQEGGTIGPFTQAGECFELRVDNTKDNSSFTVNTAGLAAIALFTEHVPTEFERDMHYLKDSSGNNVEPVLQENGGHHDHGHDHGHGHDHDDDDDKPTCACVAEEYKFNMDCNGEAAMLDALSILKNTGCATDCSSDECQKNWYIVQAHHDYCDPQALPTAVEDDFHDFDQVCESCAIDRIFIEGAPDCPAPNCEDQSGNQAYAFLVDNGCTVGCADKPECRENYITLRVVHDGCDHEVLTTDAEEGLHDFEESCETVVCNAQGSQDDQLTCTSGSMGAMANVLITSMVALIGAGFAMA